MAYKKKNYKKKGRKKSRFGSNTTTQLSIMRGPLPQKYTTKMVYSDNIVINAPSAFAADYVFSCNGMYDPNLTGIGHQPRGFDQLMLMYDHYVVIGAKIVVRFDNSQNTKPVMAGIMVLDRATPNTTILDWQETATCKKQFIQGSGGTSTGVITYSINPNKFLGRSKPLADPTLKGTTAANPTESCAFHVGVWAADASTDLSAVDAVVQIEYMCVLIEPKIVASS